MSYHLKSSPQSFNLKLKKKKRFRIRHTVIIPKCFQKQYTYDLGNYSILKSLKLREGNNVVLDG